MCCNFCSSSGVHGVFVLPFFFIAVSGVSGGAVADVPSAAEDAEIGTVANAPALFEARRFRGFASVADEVARVPAFSSVNAD
jgi:hypothetical protein